MLEDAPRTGRKDPSILLFSLQETDTQVIDVQSSNPDLVAEWKKKVNEDVDIVSAVLKADRKDSGDGGLGISLEGN